MYNNNVVSLINRLILHWSIWKMQHQTLSHWHDWKKTTHCVLSLFISVNVRLVQGKYKSLLQVCEPLLLSTSCVTHLPINIRYRLLYKADAGLFFSYFVHCVNESLNFISCCLTQTCAKLQLFPINSKGKRDTLKKRPGFAVPCCLRVRVRLK